MYIQRDSSGPFTFNYFRNYEGVSYIHMYTQHDSSGLSRFLFNYLGKYENVVYTHMYT